MNAHDVKAARKRLSLSVDRFAEVLGVSTRNVRRWEDGTKEVPSSCVILIGLLTSFPDVRKRLIPARDPQAS